MSENPVHPSSVSDLELHRERSRIDINEFLESDSVNHQLGGVPGWKAAFGARHHGELLAVCVLSRPVSRHLDNGDVISISRYGSIPSRPPNTGSWLIARARNWAYLEGYEKIVAYAGVAGNFGTIYEASGFELDKCERTQGDGWSNREGREVVSEYTRRRWSYSFSD